MRGRSSALSRPEHELGPQHAQPDIQYHARPLDGACARAYRPGGARGCDFSGTPRSTSREFLGEGLGGHVANVARRPCGGPGRSTRDELRHLHGIRSVCSIFRISPCDVAPLFNLGALSLTIDVKHLRICADPRLSPLAELECRLFQWKCYGLGETARSRLECSRSDSRGTDSMFGWVREVKGSGVLGYTSFACLDRRRCCREQPLLRVGSTF